MTLINEIFSGRPTESRTDIENDIYDFLKKLNISFSRVDHEYANTMEDCLEIEKLLGCKICKNLFLCNRQQTEFYLLMMPGDKVFKTKFLTTELGCSRLSFANEEFMSKFLRTTPGSVSILELAFDNDNNIRLIIDSELLNEEYIGVHPGVSTSTLKISKNDILTFAKAVQHTPTIINLKTE